MNDDWRQEAQFATTFAAGIIGGLTVFFTILLSVLSLALLPGYKGKPPSVAWHLFWSDPDVRRTFAFLVLPAMAVATLLGVASFVFWVLGKRGQ